MGKHGPRPANRRRRGAPPGGRTRRRARIADHSGARRRPVDVLRAVRRHWHGQPRRWRNTELAGVVTAVALTGVLATALDRPGGPAGAGAPVHPQPPLRTVVALPAPTAATAPPTGPVPSPAPSFGGTPSDPTGAAPPSGTRPTRGTVDLCGAPANPYGYNLCGHGAPVRGWAADVCSYFTCASDFGDSGGYLVMCGDNVLSTSEATGRGCAHHRGTARPVSGP